MSRQKEVGLSLTLSELVAQHGMLQSVCRRCKHTLLIYPATLIERFGAATHSVELQSKMRCTKCGHRGARIYDRTT